MALSAITSAKRLETYLAGGGATTSSTTDGSSEAFRTVSSRPAGTSTVSHCFIRARPFPTCAATSPASTTRMPSAPSSRIGPCPCDPCRQTISDHRCSLSTSARRLGASSENATRSRMSSVFTSLRVPVSSDASGGYTAASALDTTKEAAPCDHVLVLHGCAGGGEGGGPDPAGLPGAGVRTGRQGDRSPAGVQGREAHGQEGRIAPG